MYNENVIQINRSANGWIVVLPIGEDSAGSTMVSEWAARMPEIIRSFKEGMEDDVLAGILKRSHEGEEVEGPVSDVRAPAAISANPSVFVFFTFSDVLDFLKELPL